jgi:hypothetical protein
VYVSGVVGTGFHVRKLSSSALGVDRSFGTKRGKMKSGWIRLYRKSFENELYFADPFTRWQAWQDLLLLANHKPGILIVRGNIVKINRGQVGHSEQSLSLRWKWSRDKVRRFLKYLNSIQQIEQQQSSIINILTIKNYDKYQDSETTDDTTDKQQTIQQTIQQTDTNNNDKNDNNEKNDKNIYNVRFDFNKIWNQYPSRVGKKQAIKHFKASVKTEEDYTDIQTALDNYLQCDRVQRGYVQNGSTWFNNWRDWICPAVAPAKETNEQILEELRREFPDAR